MCDQKTDLLRREILIGSSRVFCVSFKSKKANKDLELYNVGFIIIVFLNSKTCFAFQTVRGL